MAELIFDFVEQDAAYIAHGFGEELQIFEANYGRRPAVFHFVRGSSLADYWLSAYFITGERIDANIFRADPLQNGRGRFCTIQNTFERIGIMGAIENASSGYVCVAYTDRTITYVDSESNLA